jgi:flagellar basal body-associated protein FliL
MSSYPPSNHSRAKLITIVVCSVLLLAAAAGGTALLLSKLHVKSFTQQQEATSQQQAAQAPANLKATADQELSKGDTQAALRDYKAALEAYKAAGDKANVTDLTMQISVVEKTITTNATSGKAKPTNLGVAGTAK